MTQALRHDDVSVDLEADPGVEEQDGTTALQNSIANSVISKPYSPSVPFHSNATA